MRRPHAPRALDGAGGMPGARTRICACTHRTCHSHIHAAARSCCPPQALARLAEVLCAPTAAELAQLFNPQLCMEGADDAAQEGCSPECGEGPSSSEAALGEGAPGQPQPAAQKGQRVSSKTAAASAVGGEGLVLRVRVWEREWGHELIHACTGTGMGRRAHAGAAGRSCQLSASQFARPSSASRARACAQGPTGADDLAAAPCTVPEYFRRLQQQPELAAGRAGRAGMGGALHQAAAARPMAELFAGLMEVGSWPGL